MFKWIAALVYSGDEEKAKEQIFERAKINGLSRNIEEVLIVMMKETKIVGGKRVQEEVVMFPGYLFIKTDKVSDIVEAAEGASRVIGFVGRHKNQPDEISEEEINKMRKVEQVETKSSFTAGDSVKIIDGPFAGFTAKVTKQLPHDKLELVVSIFNRDTTTQIAVTSVEKMKD